MNERKVNYDEAIMVGSVDEWNWARSAGWDPRNILGATRDQLQGRRYKTLTMTWSALEIVGRNVDLQAALAQNSILGNAEVKIGTIKAPLDVTS